MNFWKHYTTGQEAVEKTWKLVLSWKEKYGNHIIIIITYDVYAHWAITPVPVEKPRREISI